LAIDAPAYRVYATPVEPQGISRFEHFDARAGGWYRMRLTYAEVPESGGKSSVDSDVFNVRLSRSPTSNGWFRPSNGNPMTPPPRETRPGIPADAVSAELQRNQSGRIFA
jgi:hypothetical protein